MFKLSLKNKFYFLLSLFWLVYASVLGSAWYALLTWEYETRWTRFGIALLCLGILALMTEFVRRNRPQRDTEISARL